MAKIFLDTNIFIDLVEDRGNKNIAQVLDGQKVYVSPLSTHIMFYVGKKRVPDNKVNATISQFEIVNLTKEIHDNSLDGPTTDLEDNIQLHSATEVNSDYFLTNDDKLLKMKFFGKTKIVNCLPQNH